MTLQEAIETYQSKYESVKKGEKGQVSKDHMVLWSGGIRKHDESAWALYSTKDAAILDWLDAAMEYLPLARGTLEWIVKPVLMEYIITIQDQRGQQRVVNNRYAVKSQYIAYSEKTEDVESPSSPRD